MKRIPYICGGLAVAAVIVMAAGVRFSQAPLAVPPADLTIRLMFTGDMMFDRAVARHGEQFGPDSLLRGVRDLLHGIPAANDAVIGNLEGALTIEPSIAQKNNKILRFTFDPAYAGVIKDAGFTAVSLANNHSMDFYRAGYVSTQKYLDEQGILHFGSASNDTDLSTSFTVKGKQICLVGYHDLYTYDENPAIAEIVRLRSSCDFLVVVPHWGNEYELTASDRQRELAYEFIDAGADLIIGAHPHVVQPVEIYRGRAIFYSLGNFVFDQRLSFWTEHGLAVQVILHQNGKKDFVLTPTVLNNIEVGVANEMERAKVLKITGLESGTFSLPQ